MRKIYLLFSWSTLTATPKAIFASFNDPMFFCDNDVVYTLRKMGFSQEEIDDFKNEDPDRVIVLIRNRRRYQCLYWKRRLEEAYASDKSLGEDTRFRYLLRLIQIILFMSVKTKIIFEDFGEKKLNVVKIVKKQLGLGLKEAKQIVDSVPTTYDCKDMATAIKFVVELQRAGAKAHIYEMASDSLQRPTTIVPHNVVVLGKNNEKCVATDSALGIEFTLKGSTDVHTLLLKSPQAALIRAAVGTAMEDNVFILIDNSSPLIDEIERITKNINK